MSGFENYSREMADLDQEIHHYAAICGVDLADRVALRRCLEAPCGSRASGQAQETLHGLLILRIKVETEMLEQGLRPPPLIAAPDLPV